MSSTSSPQGRDATHDDIMVDSLDDDFFDDGSVPGDSSPETPLSEDGSWFSKPIVDKFLIYALKRKLYIEMLPAPDFPEHDASIQADLSRQHLPYHFA